jgi:hypothetical protein
MIGKVTIGASFYHCISYCLEDKRKLSDEQKEQLSLQEGLQYKGRAEILEYNRCFGDKRELTEQFRDVGKLSRRVEKPVMHLSIRAAPGDQLTTEQWREIGRAAAKEFGLDDHQFICVLHKDTRQPHIHVVGNRVGYDGKVASDSNSYARIAALCRRLEKEYDLKQVLSPRRFLSPKERQIPRQDQRKEQLKADIKQALQGARTYQDFEKRMQNKGYLVDKGRGIAIMDNKKVRTKGSEVGYSLQTIEQVLAQNEQKKRLSSSQPKEKTQQREMARKNVTRAMHHHPILVEEKSIGFAIGDQIAHGISNVLHEMLKPEISPAGGGRNPWAEEEEWRRRKKKKGQSHPR